jgi:hypothetical protein
LILSPIDRAAERPKPQIAQKYYRFPVLVVEIIAFKEMKIMKKLILHSILFCIMILFFAEISSGENSESRCNSEHERCAESCERKHSTPKYDVWGKARKESEITLGRREKCKDQCLALKDFCLERRRKFEDAEKVQKELENEIEETEEYSGGDTFPEYPMPSSDSNIYKWTDKDGVIHITNKIDSIPPEYLEQVEQSTNEKSKITKGESE